MVGTGQEEDKRVAVPRKGKGGGREKQQARSVEQRITGVQGLKGCLDHSKTVKIRAWGKAQTAC